MLESHGIPQGRMSLDEMLKAARAMRQNGVRLPQSCAQMAGIYLSTLRRVEQHAGGQAVEAAEPQATEAPEEPEAPEAAAEELPKPVDGDGPSEVVPVAPEEMLAEAGPGVAVCTSP